MTPPHLAQVQAVIASIPVIQHGPILPPMTVSYPCRHAILILLPFHVSLL